MSKKFIILPDVTCDLNKELREKYDIEYIKGHISYPDGSEEYSSLEWEDCSYINEKSADAFFTELKRKPNDFTTSPPSVQEYYNKFEQYILEGYDVLSMSISSGMSGTYNFTVTAKEMIEEKYKDAKIYCFDTLRFGPGFGLMAIYASILRSEGKTIDEVYEFLMDIRSKFHQIGWLDDLSFVAAKGRISHAKAFMGSLIGIKPLGESDHTGLTTVIGKAKGEKSGLKAIIEYIKETAIDIGEQIIVIAHSMRLKQALKLKELIEENFNPKAIYINEVHMSCGVNIGPGLLAAYYIGKPISLDLEEEKQILARVLAK